MGKLITSTMLTSALGSAWDIIKTGERISEATEGWGTDEHASLAEGFVKKTGRAITAMGERLELSVNWLAMKLGYSDGEVSGMVAWPALAH
jgi:hypothetical protein